MLEIEFRGMPMTFSEDYAGRCHSIHHLLSIMDGMRLNLLLSLAETPANVTGLARTLQCDPSSVSRAVAQLRGAGLIDMTTEGRYHMCTLGSRIAVAKDGLHQSLTLVTEDGSHLAMLVVQHRRKTRPTRTTRSRSP